MVRAELMEQVPHLAMYCQENPHLFNTPITTYILPTTVKYLIDSNNQVQCANTCRPRDHNTTRGLKASPAVSLCVNLTLRTLCYSSLKDLTDCKKKKKKKKIISLHSLLRESIPDTLCPFYLPVMWKVHISGEKDESSSSTGFTGTGTRRQK